jgi:hypothetical protein
MTCFKWLHMLVTWKKQKECKTLYVNRCEMSMKSNITSGIERLVVLQYISLLIDGFP